jgi:hypothetical protein
MTAGEHLSDQQFTHLPVHYLRTTMDPEYDEVPFHRDQVDKLVDSMREHGYRPEMADHPIELLRSKKGAAALEGKHRIMAAHYAGIKKLPVLVHEIGQS